MYVYKDMVAVKLPIQYEMGNPYVEYEIKDGDISFKEEVLIVFVKAGPIVMYLPLSNTIVIFSDRIL